MTNDSTSTPVAGVDTNDVDDIAGILAALTDHDARHRLALTFVPDAPVAADRKAALSRTLRTYGGLSQRDFDDIYRENCKRYTKRKTSATVAGSTYIIEIPSSKFTDPVPSAIVDTDTGLCRGIEVNGRTIPVPHLHGIYLSRTDDGAPINRYYLLSHGSNCPTPIAFTDDDIKRGLYIEPLGIDVPEDRNYQNLVVTYLRILGKRLPAQEARARWTDDGTLAVPPRELLPPGFLRTMGSEGHAVETWREIATMLCEPGADNPALLVGAAMAGTYVARMGATKPASAMWVPIGEPRTGKSIGCNLAASLYGSAAAMNPAFSESKISIGEELATLGVLPYWRDEAHAADLRSNEWKALIMSLANGAGRRRAGRTGGRGRSAAQWWGYMFISANLDVRFGATDGVRARVIALNSPHSAGKEQAERLDRLAQTAYGWPFVWLLRKALTPAVYITDYYNDALATLEGRYTSGTNTTIAQNLAMGIAGAHILGEFVGVPGLRNAAIRGAIRALKGMELGDADTPLTFADQLLADVWNDVAQNPGAWVDRETYANMQTTGRVHDNHGNVVRHTDRDVHGIHDVDRTGREYCAFVPNPFRNLVATKDYDWQSGLRDLQESGLSESNDSASFRYQMKINQRKERFYYFRPPLDSVGAEQAPEPVGPIAAPVVEPPEEAITLTEPAIPSHPGDVADDDVSSDYPVYVAADAPPEGEIARFTTAITPDDGMPDFTTDDAHKAFAIWSELMDGQRFDSYPGAVGLAMFRRAVAMNSKIVDPEKLSPESDELIRGLSERTIKYNDFLDNAREIDATSVATGYDVRAQFVGAASSVEMGDGDPEIFDNPLSVRSFLSMPGYVELADDVDTGTPWWGTLESGTVITTPTAKYLSARGVQMKATRVVAWDKKGKRLGVLARKFGAAYKALSVRTDKPAVLALRAVKSVYASLLGGMIRSDTFNGTSLLRFDYSDMLVTTAGANMLRALDKETLKTGNAPIGINRDSAWWISDDVYEAQALELTVQPGKWRLNKIAVADDGLIAAYESGSVPAFRDNLNRIARGE